MKTLLSSGTCIVTDRYAFSGVAFTAAKVRLTSYKVVDQSGKSFYQRTTFPGVLSPGFLSTTVSVTSTKEDRGEFPGEDTGLQMTSSLLYSSKASCLAFGLLVVPEDEMVRRKLWKSLSRLLSLCLG